MRAVQIFTPGAVLASIASASALPRAAIDCNFATGWYVALPLGLENTASRFKDDNNDFGSYRGCWTVTNLTESIPPSANYHTFNFIVGHQSQTKTTKCTGTSEVEITCDDSAFQVDIDLGVSTMTIHEKLYQTGAIAVLGGNASLATTCAMNSMGTSWTCTQSSFDVKSELVGTIYPNGTTEGYTF